MPKTLTEKDLRALELLHETTDARSNPNNSYWQVPLWAYKPSLKLVGLGLARRSNPDTMNYSFSISEKGEEQLPLLELVLGDRKRRTAR